MAPLTFVMTSSKSQKHSKAYLRAHLTNCLIKVIVQCIKVRLLLQRGFNSIVYFCSHFRTVGGAFYYRDWNQNTQQDLIPCGICNAAQRGPCLLAHQSLNRATGTYRDVGTGLHQVLSRYKNKTYFNNKPVPEKWSGQDTSQDYT